MPGFPAEPVEVVKQGLICPHCQLVLREAVQTDEGVRLCQSCYKEIALMPDSTCTDCHTVINPHKGAFPDRAVRRDILEMVVKCAHVITGCPWQGRLKNWENHCEQCTYHEIECPNEGCEVKVLDSELAAHLVQCPYRRVMCEHCSTEQLFLHIHAHYEQCPSLPVICNWCQARVKRNELNTHSLNDCTVEECGVCGEKVLRETKENIDTEEPSAKFDGKTSSIHLSDPKSVFMHMKLLSSQVSQLQREMESTFEELRSSQKEMRQQINGYQQQLLSLERQMLSGVQSNKALVSRVDALEAKELSRERATKDQESQLNDLKGQLQSLKESCERNSKALTELQVSARQGTGSAGAGVEAEGILGRKVEEMEIQMNTVKISVSELELQLQASLASTHNGAFLWRIPDVARRRREAIEEKITSIYSPPFYTGIVDGAEHGKMSGHHTKAAEDSPLHFALWETPDHTNGYKMCVRAYLNGDGIGYGTHLSIFFVLMKGEYDPLLKWPFESKVSLILVDQNHRQHIVQTFKPTPESSSFQQPQNDMNVASGCPQFAKLTVLDNNSYVKEDVIYVKCIVDTSRIFHP